MKTIIAAVQIFIAIVIPWLIGINTIANITLALINGG